MNVHDFDIDDLELNMSASYKTVLTDKEVEGFADLSGDYSPLHVDKKFGRSTQFGRNLVHGMLVSAHFSTIVGMILPGRNALLSAVRLNYLKPVPVGSEVIVSGAIKKIQKASRTIVLNLLAFYDNEMVVQGSAQVKILEPVKSGKGQKA